MKINEICVSASRKFSHPFESCDLSVHTTLKATLADDDLDECMNELNKKAQNFVETWKMKILFDIRELEKNDRYEDKKYEYKREIEKLQSKLEILEEYSNALIDARELKRLDEYENEKYAYEREIEKLQTELEILNKK